MRKHAKDKRPSPKPVIKAELAEGHKNVRIIFVVVLLALGITLIAFSAARLLGREDGYTKIEVDDSIFSDLFVLNYDIGASGATASMEYRKVRDVYSGALDKYCKLFSADTSYDSVANICYLNSHPGERTVIDSELYSALLRMEKEGKALHYLGIVLEMYDVVFSCDGDAYAKESDPMKNAEMGALLKEACRFASDRDAVSLEFFSDSSVVLNVSDEYRKFAEDFGFVRFIDLGIFENAFVLDAIAEKLSREGMCFGAVSSYDGYTRNLDTRTDMAYSFSFYAKANDTVYPVCDVSYTGSVTACHLKSYPTSGLDTFDFYLYSNGESVHRLIDASSGKSVSVKPELLILSKEEDAVSLALRGYNTLVAEQFSADELDGVFAAWLEGYEIKSTDSDDVRLSLPFNDGEISFTIE